MTARESRPLFPGRWCLRPSGYVRRAHADSLTLFAGVPKPGTLGLLTLGAVGLALLKMAMGMISSLIYCAAGGRRTLHEKARRSVNTAGHGVA